MTDASRHDLEWLAQQVADAVTGCPGVASLTSRAIATYLPGRRIEGVDVDGDTVRIGLVVRWDHTVTEVATDVRRAVAPLVGGRPIDISVEDIDFDSVLDLRRNSPEEVST